MPYKVWKNTLCKQRKLGNTSIKGKQLGFNKKQHVNLMYSLKMTILGVKLNRKNALSNIFARVIISINNKIKYLFDKRNTRGISVDSW